MNSLQTTSPAYNRQPVEGSNSLEELPWSGKINLRGNPDNNSFTSSVQGVLGFKLPLKAHTCAKAGDVTCYWLGPDEWLVHCNIEKLETIIQNLKSVLSGIHSAVVDVSDYYSILKLDGPDASTLLAKACSLDLHPDEFKINACTQTRFGHASILLHKTSANPTYLIQTRWSYTEYIWDYLLSGMKTL
jgi:sarcosine oxidase subunit gamma